jgi:hypothetical protein
MSDFLDSEPEEMVDLRRPVHRRLPLEQAG